MAKFDVRQFESFCTRLRIDTKEKGLIPMMWLGGQRYLIEEIAKGLEEGIHTFIVLKGRQMGISTVMLALDLYWMFLHKGLQGAIVTDTDENREVFRTHIASYHASLPAQFRVPKIAHNRVQLVLKNRSKLVYMVAGTKKNGGLGRAKSANFMHATEMSTWGDEEGLASLMNTLAQQNENRLYVFESTARGYDMFYQMYVGAKESTTQKAIFIGWWRNELYRIERGTPQFAAYWDGAPTSEEKVWLEAIWLQYHVNLEPEQIAWWRWYCTEMVTDENMALQEMPPTEDYAFQLSGSKFFSSERVNIAFQHAQQQERLYFRYDFGSQFEHTQFVETNESNAEVCIWEMPQENGVYAFGCDPAFGSSEWADEFCIQILRCFSDRVVQVGEVASADYTEQQFAWIIAHLAGNYKNCMVNLEMQGPGGTVLNELRNLQTYGGVSRTLSTDQKGIYNVLAGIRHYLWRKQDSLSGSLALQWQTNHREKLRMMTTLRSYFERDMLQLNGPELVQQFRNIHRSGDSIGGEGRAKDDRVIALAIGVIAWNDHLKVECESRGMSYDKEMRPPEVAVKITPLESAYMRFMKSNNIIQAPGPIIPK